ncbi:MAG: hypothetical protein HY942_04205 [Gammaproteobacteria bacterium]|nr:hypothetical protein [Gammaproteobacteria bacterium]
MNPRPATRRLFRTTLLVSVLLLAQWVLAVHHTELAAHAAAGACEFCLTHADLTDGSTLASPPPVVVPAAAPVPAFFPAAFAAPRHPSYSARAPPLSYR